MHTRVLATLRGSLLTLSVIPLVLLVTAQSAAATTCGGFNYRYTQVDTLSRSYWGVAGHISLPQNALLPAGPDRAHVANYFGVVDAFRDPNVGFSGCQGSDCQIQSGLIFGTTSDCKGTPLTTSVNRPYVEANDKNGCTINVLFNFNPAASPTFKVYDTRITDSAGFHKIRAVINNNVGSGDVTLGEAYLRQGTDFQLAASSERVNTVQADCPVNQNQEFGTYGYGTRFDSASVVSLRRASDGVQVGWNRSSVPDTNVQQFVPYSYGSFTDFGAWNTYGG